MRRCISSLVVHRCVEVASAAHAFLVGPSATGTRRVGTDVRSGTAPAREISAVTCTAVATISKPDRRGEFHAVGSWFRMRTRSSGPACIWILCRVVESLLLSSLSHYLRLWQKTEIQGICLYARVEEQLPDILSFIVFAQPACHSLG